MPELPEVETVARQLEPLVRDRTVVGLRILDPALKRGRFPHLARRRFVEVGRSGKRVLVAAHGNVFRALIKHLDGVSDEDIVGVNVPTAVPLVYELDDRMKPVRHYYLGDPGEVERAQQAEAGRLKAE